MNTKTKKKEEAKEHIEHLMESFPEPRTMPAEWHEHDVATAKLKMASQAKKAETATKKALDVSEKADAEKEAHLMEAFPGLKTEPKHWHCTTCEDEK